MQVKLRALNSFLEEGEQVRLVVVFRGREIVHPHLGELSLRWLIVSASERGTPNGEPRLEGKRMSVVMNPRKRG